MMEQHIYYIFFFLFFKKICPKLEWKWFFYNKEKGE